MTKASYYSKKKTNRSPISSSCSSSSSYRGASPTGSSSAALSNSSSAVSTGLSNSSSPPFSGKKNAKLTSRKTSRGRRVFFLPMNSEQNKAVPSSLSKAPVENAHPNPQCGQQHQRHSRGKKSSSSGRWKYMLLKRLRDKDTRRLNFLQSRPPPPTVGPNDDDKYLEMNMEEPLHHIFDQVDCSSVEGRWEGQRGEEDAAVECGRHAEMSLHAPPVDHIDFFGSYLQDYELSDYRRDLFDENMMICS